MPVTYDQARDETLVAVGEAESVMDADRLAWDGLESVIGNDDPAAWALVEMKHALKKPGLIEWMATFSRDPNAESPPNLKAAEATYLDASKRDTADEAEVEQQEQEA